MKIIVGLGNPGKQYAGTPHNVGFTVTEALAGLLDCRLRRSFRFPARIGKAARNDWQTWLVQPQTYMNKSGAAAAAIARYLKVQPRDLIAVLDDADLPIGRIRVRPAGGSGGHKGLASVIQALGTEAFPRVRVGIGRDLRGGKELADYVLAPFSPEERERMAVVVDRAAQAVLCIADFGAEAAMNRFNGLDGPAPAGATEDGR